MKHKMKSYSSLKDLSQTHPDSPAGTFLTKRFLEYALGRELTKFSWKLGSNPGDNYLSILYALEITFRGEKKPHHYLIKCYPKNLKRRKWMDQLNIFKKELFIYQELIPKLKEVIGANGIDVEAVDISSAPFHGGNAGTKPSPKWKDTEWDKESFIIMTDLRKSGFAMKDRIIGLDMEHAMLVLQEMARWHALAWAHKEKNGWKLLSSHYPGLVDGVYSDETMADQFKYYGELVKATVLKVTEEALGDGHPAHISLKKLIEKGVGETICKYVKPQGVNEDFFEGLLRIKPEDDGDYDKEPWLTGTHGDCWMNNLLFRYETIGGSDHPTPVQVTFVDLQFYREACPTIDIAYFLLSSVRAPIRIPRLDELLLAYHDSFLRSCRELKVRPYPGFSPSSLRRRYQRARVYGMLVSLDMLNFVFKPKEEAFDLDKPVDDSGEVDPAEMYTRVLEGADKNVKFREELSATVVDLYDTGVI